MRANDLSLDLFSDHLPQLGTFFEIEVPFRKDDPHPYGRVVSRVEPRLHLLGTYRRWQVLKFSGRSMNICYGNRRDSHPAGTSDLCRIMLAASRTYLNY